MRHTERAEREGHWRRTWRLMDDDLTLERSNALTRLGGMYNEGIARAPGMAKAWRGEARQQDGTMVRAAEDYRGPGGHWRGVELVDGWRNRYNAPLSPQEPSALRAASSVAGLWPYWA